LIDDDAGHLVAEPAEVVMGVELELTFPVHVVETNEHVQAAIREYLDLDVILAPGPVDEDVSRRGGRQRRRQTLGTSDARHESHGVLSA
jgi:hypothetical protein